MTNGFATGWKRVAKECSLVARSFILAFLLSSVVVPPQWLYAHPPNSKFFRNASPLNASGDDATQMAMIRERQRRRDVIMGIDPKRLLSDPYLLEGQQVEVETWRALKTNRTLRDGEELQVVQENGKSVEYAVSRKVYDYGHPNTNYTPPTSYSLGKDIRAEISAESVALVLELTTINGKTLFRHRFQAPGVVSVANSDLSVNLFFRNGDTRNVVMAHHRLFDVNQSTGGVPLPLALVDATDALELNPAPVPEGFVLETYDWRRARNYQWDSSIPESARKAIRYGDDIYVQRNADGSGIVRRVLTLSATMEALQGHEEHFLLRQELLSQERPFVAMLRGMDEGLILAQERPELLAAVSELDEAMQWMTNTTVAEAFRRTQPQWDRNPTELPQLASEMLGQMQKFTAHTKDFASQVSQRSTFPISKSPLAEGSPEKAEQDAIRNYSVKVDELKETRDALLSASASRWSKILSSMVVPSAYLTAFAAANAWIYLLPNSPFFLQTKLFDFGHGISGPMVPYFLKFWLVGFSNLAFFFWVLPLSFAAMSERVLGRPTLHGFHVGFRQNLETGWEAFTTFGLNMASYLMMSLRNRFAWACSKVGITTPSQVLLAMKHGMSPRSVLRKKFRWVGDLGKSALNAVVGLWKKPEALSDSLSELQSSAAKESENPLDMVAEADNNTIRSRFLAIFAMVTRLGDLGIVSSGQSLTPALLQRHLGEEDFQRLESKFLVVSALIERLLDKGFPVQGLSIAELTRKLLDNRELADALQSPLENLSASESRVLRAVKNQGLLARVWPRLAGNEFEFLRYRRAIASQGSVDIVSDTFPTDCGTNPISMGLAPGDKAFASAVNPDMLIASDRGLLGVVGYKPLTDNLFVNDIGWIAMITTDEKNYGDEHALQIPFSMQNPQYSESDHNVTWVRLRSAKRATFFQTLRSWVTFTDPRGADFWEGLERFGERITIAQVKTWKPTALVGMAGAMIGYAAELPKFLTGQGLVGVATGLVSVSLIKTFMQEAIGYLGYRPAWSWNSVGVTRSKTEVRENTSELAALIRDLVSVTALAKSDGPSANVAPVSAQLVKIEAFYNRMGAEFPEHLRKLENVLERADETIVEAMLNPPMVTDRSEAAGKFSNLSMGVATTIGQALVGALAWSTSAGLSWGACGLVLGVTYGWGLLMRSAGSIMRATLSYGQDLGALRVALEAFQTSPSEENRRKLYSALVKAVRTYRRYGAEDKLQGLLLESVRREDDVQVFATNLYRTMLENPPVNNAGSRYSIRHEQATEFCARVISEAKAAN